MGAICQTASGGERQRGAALAFRSPRGLAESLMALGPVVTLRLRTQRFLEALRGRRRKRNGGGPGEPPEIDPAAYSYCDDPVLWMLIMWH